MKKFVKWFIFWLVILGGIALAICYMVIPTETKSAIDIVVGYLNTPLGVAGGTTITLGFVAGVIIKLVYDRYKDTIRNDLEKAKEYAEQQKNQAKGYYELAIEEREQIIDMLSSYDKRIDDILDKVCLVCETVPNAKVNKLAQSIKDNATKLKEELKESLEEQYNSFVDSIGKKSRIETLEEQIAILTEQIERLVNDNGSEERIND